VLTFTRDKSFLALRAFEVLRMAAVWAERVTGAGQMNVLFLIPMAMIALWLIAQLWNVGRS
jgi:hypothetical protein